MQVKKNKILFIIFLTFFFNSAAYSKITVKTAWQDNYVIDNPILEELIKSDVVTRLKFIDQSGPLLYFNKAPKFSRYEHSIGVLALLQKANVSLKEQVAGLLHDTSHTAFSHVGDHLLYKENKDKSYQDIIHLDFLNHMKVHEIVSKHNISLEDLEPDQYQALEQPLPNLCADRIQYIIHTGVIFNKISSKEAKEIIDDLSYTDGNWYFNSKDLAKKFSNLSLHFTKELWGAPWNFVFYEYFAETIKHALKLNIISIEDIKFGKDNDVMNLMGNNADLFMKTVFRSLEDIDRTFSITDYHSGDIRTKPKFRGVDPLIKKNGTLKRLSEIDNDFKERFINLEKWCKEGYGIKMLVKYKNIENNQSFN